MARATRELKRFLVVALVAKRRISEYPGRKAVHLEKFVGAPEGNYESVLFKTAFERKNPTAEPFILIKQPIGWRVIDYRLY